MKNSRHKLWPGVLPVSFMNYSIFSFCFSHSSLFFLWMFFYILLKKSLFNAAKIYMLELQYKAEIAKTTCTIYHLNSGAVYFTMIATFIIWRTRNSKHIPNEMMTNQGETKTETIQILESLSIIFTIWLIY